MCVPPPFGLTFEREDFRALLAKEIAAFKPDVIVLDPWNAVAPDDRAADYLETFRVIRSVIPAGDDAPALGIVAHTRKPKSDEKAGGRGLLNLLAGSYVLGSVPRCAFVLQAASDDPEDRRVVWTCCKNNDGEMGARSAWVRCNGLFQPVTDFDWDAFDNAGSAKAPKWKAVVEIVQAADSPLTKAAIATALKARNVAQATAYRWIDSAAGDGAISFDENGGVYRLPSHCDSQ